MTRTDALRIADYLRHITEAIDRIQRYVAGVSLEAFLQDQKTQDAVIRNIEIIGEAAHNIERHHPAFAAEHPDVPWALMYTMRNRVAHGYFKVDLDLVWKTLRADLPLLQQQVQRITPPQP